MCQHGCLCRYFIITTGINKPLQLCTALPSLSDLPLALLGKELKVNHFFYGMQELGFGECPHQPCLGTIILQLMQLDVTRDEVWTFYVTHSDYYTKRMSKTHNRKRTMHLALQFYHDLQGEHKRWQKARVKV